jgi:DNA topoisomerase III
LEEEARKCQWLVLWLDCDREGENIAFEVIEVCTAANRYLNLWRARFSALIDRHVPPSDSYNFDVVTYFLVSSVSDACILNDREIHYSVQNLVQPNKWFADAVDARQVIVLMTMSRIATCKLLAFYMVHF